jgi:hypothetical protein
MSLMPLFKIHRLRDSEFQQFRWAPHTAGVSQIKPRDYGEAGQVEAPGPYAAWTALRESGKPLRIGDVLEEESGKLRIFKYVGLEEAQWIVPEPKAEAESSAPGALDPAVPEGDSPKS